jgi:Alginate lyase
MKIRIYLLIFLIVISVAGNSQVKIKGTEDRISLNEFKFTHPMTVTSSKEIAIVKDRIKKGVEPQATAYKKLIQLADSQMSFVPDPPDSMNVMGGYEPNNNLKQNRAWLWRNCNAAYTLALAYTYTGETKYADKAIEVLNAWAVKGTVFTGADRGLQLGSYFSPMLYSADLLNSYTGWTVNKREVFKKWWVNNCLIHTTEVMRTRFNNWLDAGILGTMCAAVVFEDKMLLQESLNYLLSYYKANKNEKVAKFGTAWKMTKDDRGTYLTTEVTRNDGRSGITYTYYSLTTGVQCLEIARYAGFDFWQAATPQGATFQKVIEQLFKWSMEGQNFPWNSKPDNKKTNQFNCFEIANNNCQLPKSMIDWLNVNRPVHGAQGDEYVTLNKGDCKVALNTKIK